MESEFIYWRHPTVPGIKVEEVTGGDRYKGTVWREMAEQVYCENGRESYREIGHYPDGAPFLFGEQARISITHCDGLYAVATLPSTPEVDLAHFSRRAAMGIDAERIDRQQVLRLRERFLNEAELCMIPSDDIEQNILAWTVKEAAYKAAFIPGLDFRQQINIIRLPRPASATPVFDPSDFGLPKGTKEIPEEFFGEVTIVTNSNGEKLEDDPVDGNNFSCRMSPVEGDLISETILLKVYSYRSDEFIITLCYDPRCAKFGKQHSI